MFACCLVVDNLRVWTSISRSRSNDNNQREDLWHAVIAPEADNVVFTCSTWTLTLRNGTTCECSQDTVTTHLVAGDSDLVQLRINKHSLRHQPNKTVMTKFRESICGSKASGMLRSKSRANCHVPFPQAAIALLKWKTLILTSWHHRLREAFENVRHLSKVQRKTASPATAF